MTIITKISTIKKTPVIITDVPLADKEVLEEKSIFEEEKVEIYPDYVPEPKISGTKFLSVVAVMFVALCLISALMVCRELVKPDDNDCVKAELELAPPRRWYPDGSLEVMTIMEPAKRGPSTKRLVEKINIKDNVETLTVVSDGHVVNFIHDFNDNTSGIVDKERCFVMELMPELVMTPELFISGLVTDAVFDPTPVRSELLVELPALRDLRRAAAGLATACVERPVYRLYRAERNSIRKRSADEPQFGVDYMQFAGLHVEQIRLNNREEMLEYEKTIKA